MPYGCFSKLWTSQKSRTLQSPTVCFSRVSYLFECNANDTYVLRMIHISENSAISFKGYQDTPAADAAADAARRVHMSETLGNSTFASTSSSPLRCNVVFGNLDNPEVCVTHFLHSTLLTWEDGKEEAEEGSEGSLCQ